jgi:zinc/manganese transport system substrate-binding protein
VLQVVAAENFWGSLASQLGGRRVHVTSIVTDPNADPHEYESNPADARLLAKADFVIVNGAGYDDWASKLLGAEPAAGRKVLTVAALLGKKDGDNPHFWYDPNYVFKVVDQISKDLESLEPSESSYFDARSKDVQDDLAPYRQRLAYIRQHFAGRPVAATESIFQYMAEYLRLDLVTPYPFMEAVAEGNDPPAADEATFEQQIRAKAFDVLVYNVQTVTPLTTGIKEQTAQQDIPVIGVSETIQPPIASFEEWMDGELDTLANALNANALGS